MEAEPQKGGVETEPKPVETEPKPVEAVTDADAKPFQAVESEIESVSLELNP
jgi:hypothetical protein